MSRGFIKVTAKGNLGSVEFNTLPSGDRVANLSLAATNSYTDKSGQKQESTTWVRLVGYKKTAELLEQLVQQGTELLVEGNLSVNKWEDQNGNNRETTEIVVSSFEVLRRGKEREDAQQQGYNNQQQQGYNNQQSSTQSMTQPRYNQNNATANGQRYMNRPN